MDLKKYNLKNEKVLILAAFILLIVMVFLLVSQWGKLTEAQNRLYDEEDALNMINLRVQQLLEIRSRAPAFASYLIFLEYLMPYDAYEESLIEELKIIAWENGIELSGIRFENRQAIDEDFVELPMNVSFKGNYSGFLNFLRQIQKPAERFRAFRIDNIEQTRDSLVLNINAFYREKTVEADISGDSGTEFETEEIYNSI